MNVLHVHSGNMFGGVERMLQTLAPATAGRTPISSSFALCFEGRVSETLHAAGGEVYPLGPVRARRIGEIRRARRILTDTLRTEEWGAAIVHSAWAQAIFGQTIVGTGTPLVRWLHAPQPGPRWLEYWSARSTPALVLCNSRYTCSAVGTGLGDVPRAVVYPPAAAHAPQRDARQTIRKALGAAADAVVIVISARMESWKGHELLLESLAALPGGRWEAWVIGGPQGHSERRYFNALVQRADTAGLGARVRFLGQRSDVSTLLEASDIYCQPNRGPEPFGLSFVEALAAGLPVVTSRLGAAPEIVDDSCGVLVDAGLPGALTEVLSQLIQHDDRRRTMSIAARERSRQFCDLPGSLRHLAVELGRVSVTATART